ncbi:MAG TPA: hypothetical protein VNL77_15885 [Roseiflexaceae bacterium]|nr:hypothetical protein [Roseiflexaceae bacterium]
MYSFQPSVGDGAGGRAAEGRGKLTLVPPAGAGAPLLRLACRDTTIAPVSEQELLDHITRVFEDAGLHFPRSLLVNYYVSLKTNPFVVLAGQEGYGKAEFAALFAEALLGRGSQQYALIPAGASWTSATGEDGYYRGLLERFASLRFLDLLQDAAGATGAGKAYLVCFNGLRPDEFAYFFTTLLQVDAAGQKRLKLPGVPPVGWPVVPPNVYVTATVNTAEYAGALSREVLRHAGLIHFRAPLLRAAIRQDGPPPAVGYQRLWLRAAVRDVRAARDRLAQILGADAMARLRCSPELARLLWRGGVVLTSRALQDLTTYVAASFDAHGRGLFAPADPQRNAQMAFDSQVVQRVLWKLHDTADEELQRDLADYLDRLAPTGWQQAVA